MELFKKKIEEAKKEGTFKSGVNVTEEEGLKLIREMPPVFAYLARTRTHDPSFCYKAFQLNPKVLLHLPIDVIYNKEFRAKFKVDKIDIIDEFRKQGVDLYKTAEIAFANKYIPIELAVQWPDLALACVKRDKKFMFTTFSNVREDPRVAYEAICHNVNTYMALTKSSLFHDERIVLKVLEMDKKMYKSIPREMKLNGRVKIFMGFVMTVDKIPDVYFHFE